MVAGSALVPLPVDEDAVLEPDDEHAANASVAVATPRTAMVLCLLVTVIKPYSFVGVR
jgi:hypothetical protein